LFRGEQRPLGLHSLNLREQQLEPIKFATNLRFEMRGWQTLIPAPARLFAANGWGIVQR
jgi:hypothetical protein